MYTYLNPTILRYEEGLQKVVGLHLACTVHSTRGMF